MDKSLLRQNMIKKQLRTWEVLDHNILTLFNDIHREAFIPADYQSLAFADMHIPLGHQQVTMTPKMEARLLQALALTRAHCVLEIGTGCAYLTCLLARLAKQVHSIDIIADFITSATAKTAAFTNIRLSHCDAYDILKQQHRYDVIVVTASLPDVDQRFINLLNDGGRMFAIIGESPAMTACIIDKTQSGSCTYENLFETDLPALIGAAQKPAFSF